ncbi:type II toxin-antitoxin system prevent-host-death family antitoxin [Acinetobacter nosocomialis]|uniref:type II toxin-antitoxin system Phd/YefM family antitoxin n=1 Tax=Acinetobacter calcoaceticus/baumannii complex TaxID=909768 RepID=UPI00228CF66B|nr:MULTISPECIES: type II toxin-antitoxin system prevent-host-death family antitoxin [Acinetobacter calcoaceticus/baumannii complex]MDO7509523.1 type II toxin-antitoxin system prevent-host-death family antitoxin [Acinetobacter baumannii]MDO7192441.1 type II toxin-antitoxin system prevent-host-death family antitoxin [Acinetobacter nosocomialis]MDV7627614.1 type II toxin-antitoxin system prevent-host-death family antitoxin [Acinetobacter baumannii]MDV7648814.1 type II toxin-antitoxin system preven
MKVVSYSDLRKNLEHVLDSVIDDHSPVLVTRQNKQTAVLISLDDFNAYEENAHLLKSSINTKRLHDSIAQIEADRTIKHELIEK